MDNAAVQDAAFRDAVAAIDVGDIATLGHLITARPALVRERLESPGTWLREKVGGALEGFFQRPYLLWFVAEDPVRNGRLPENIAEVTRALRSEEHTYELQSHHELVCRLLLEKKNNTVYAAGQIASDYRTGVPPEARQDPAFPYYGSDIQKQARYVLGNLRSVFKAAGCDLKDVVKSQVFLTELNDFYYFDQVWKEFFPSPPPRTTVQVSALAVPGCRVEIDLIAVRPGVTRRVITGAGTPTPMAHYCQGVLAGETMYAAGQIASDHRTGVPSGSGLRK